jgi:hypothetical protein
VGQLQARRERRRGLQVPVGVIEVNSDVVGELESVGVLFPIRCLMSPAARGFTFLL